MSRVYFNSGTPFASDWCVRRTRDCDFSSFPMSSYPPATSDPGIEPVLASEPLVLKRIPFTLGRQNHPLFPWVGAVDTPPPRRFSADYTKLAKVRCHSTWLTSISAQHINNIYSARVLMHFLVAHGYETPPCFMSWIMQEPFFNVTQTEGFDHA